MLNAIVVGITVAIFLKLIDIKGFSLQWWVLMVTLNTLSVSVLY